MYPYNWSLVRFGTIECRVDTLMEDLFKGQVPEGEECDLQIFIFPHLREFMTVDLRYSDPVVNLLNTQDIFTDRFYAAVEHEFSLVARRETNAPFSHLINLPFFPAHYFIFLYFSHH